MIFGKTKCGLFLKISSYISFYFKQKNLSCKITILFLNFKKSFKIKQIYIKSNIDTSIFIVCKSIIFIKKNLIKKKIYKKYFFLKD